MTRYKQPPKISKARIVRAVASSSAIETGKPVKAIEAKLKARKTHYKDLHLSF